eukprot:scaffold3241_cov424-Pavlova_lutheri.AAC.1
MAIRHEQTRSGTRTPRVARQANAHHQQPPKRDPNPRHVWTRKRKVRQEGRDQVHQGRSAVPRGTCGTLPQGRQVRHPHRSRCARVPGRRVGIPGRRSAGIGRQCRTRQQEDQDRAPPHPAGGEERRGAVQALGIRHHRFRRRVAQHPHRVVAQVQ